MPSVDPPTPAEPAGRRFGDGGPSLADVGEEALLRHLSQTARAASGGEAVIVGSGDDAAVWRPPAGADLVVSQDALVEGIDFRRDWITPHRLGRRCLEVALSDLAGMGARPAWCMATLCAPRATAFDDVLAIHAGLCEGAAANSCALIGGDVSDIAGPLVIDVCVAGVVPHGVAMRRDAGNAGDLLVVTGTLGRAAAGLRALQGSAAEDRRWLSAQLEPRARLAEGAALLAAAVRCCGDLSDGLLVDSRRTAAASGCAVELWVEALPVDAELRDGAADWLTLALGGGEDFELLAAISEERFALLQEGWPAELAPLTAVGRLREGSGLRLLDREGGAEMPHPPVLSRHFS